MLGLKMERDMKLPQLRGVYRDALSAPQISKLWGKLGPGNQSVVLEFY